ncbi:MAG: class I SAM-dependent rRNA methyltransferase [Trueperaceae bacterium]
MSAPPTLRLADHLASALASRHPWLYQDRLPKHDLPTGAWVRVEAGDASAFGLVDREGAIGVRLFAWDAVPDRAWWREAVRSAVARREAVAAAGHTAYRLIHGEGDGLPGLIADRYGRFVVVQPHTPALEPYLPTVARDLQRALRAKGVVVRRADGLETLAGEPPPPEETVVENGLRFLANLRDGQKTGLFLDHREQRGAVREMADGMRVLNLFAYAGGFSVHALAGGAAHVTDVDLAEPALRDAERNVRANDLPAQRHRTVAADVFAWLQADSGNDRYDLVILDPPSLARAKRGRARALAAYRRLNAGAARRVRPGGILLTASCTAQVAPDAFRQAVQEGLRDAGVAGRLLKESGHASDHPLRDGFPEGRYLKVLRLRIDRR